MRGCMACKTKHELMISLSGANSTSCSTDMPLNSPAHVSPGVLSSLPIFLTNYKATTLPSVVLSGRG